MTVLYLLCALLALAALYLFLISPARKHPSLRSMRNTFFAHRGLYDNQAGVPENSLAAFRLAVRAGYGVEFDIHLSKDGIPIVFHDDTLLRMCGVDVRPEDKTAEELQKLRLLNTEETIPTLAEVLAVLDGRVPVIAEIKTLTLDSAVCEEADKLLGGYRGWYCVESFNPFAMRWYKKNRPNIVRGQLSGPFWKEKKLRTAKMFVLQHMLLNVLSRPHFVAYDLHGANGISFGLSTRFFHALPVAWTVRTEEELAEAKKNFRTYIFENIRPDESLHTDNDRK